MMLFILGPLTVIIAFSFMSQPERGGGVVYQFTTTAYRRFLLGTVLIGLVLVALWSRRTGGRVKLAG